MRRKTDREKERDRKSRTERLGASSQTDRRANHQTDGQTGSQETTETDNKSRRLAEMLTNNNNSNNKDDIYKDRRLAEILTTTTT